MGMRWLALCHEMVGRAREVVGGVPEIVSREQTILL